MNSQTEAKATIPLYIAFNSAGTQPISMQFIAATSTTKATVNNGFFFS